VYLGAKRCYINTLPFLFLSFWAVKVSAQVGTVGPPVVNSSRLAKISAAMKFCTFCVVVTLLTATEASHLSGRHGADEVGRARWVCGPAAWVTLPPALQCCSGRT